MTSIELPCTVADCDYKTPVLPVDYAFQQMSNHRADAHPTQQVAAPSAPPLRQSRAPKVDRPILRDNLDEVGWNAFLQDWEMFVRANNVLAADQSINLLACCDGVLKGKMNATNPESYTKPTTELLDLLKTLAVIPVAVVVKRNELLAMHQNAGEKVRAYHARLKAQADICKFQIKCPHTHTTDTDKFVDYTNEMIHHVLLNGLYDEEIKMEICGVSGLDTLSVADLVSKIEAKETAREAVGAHATNAITQYRRQQKERYKSNNNNSNNNNNNNNNNSINNKVGGQSGDKKNEGQCSVCKTTIQLYKKLRSGKFNKQPFTECTSCWRQLKTNGSADSNEANAISFSICATSEAAACESPSTTPDPFSPEQEDGKVFLNGTWASIATPSRDLSDITVEAVSPSAAFQHHIFEDGVWIGKPAIAISAVQSMEEPSLSHHVFVNGRWIRKPAPSHPAVELVANTDQADYDFFGFQNPEILRVAIKAIVDSGAQCCVWSWKECQQAGFTREHLIPVRQKLNAVSKNTIRIYGAVVLRLCGRFDGLDDSQEAAAIVYVSPDVTGFYLSNEVMKQLSIVPDTFPSVGGATHGALHNISELEPCTCPQRTAPPGLPDKLPFDPIPENIPKMRDYILNRYASSTFNKCPHHPIPTIPGPPIGIHVDPKATPVSCSVPSQVPLHLQEKVEKGLRDDEKMGVISKVPHNVPTKWCHRMVVTPKPNGDARRTIDLSPLNKHTLREVHAMRSPFQLAKGVPANTWRTVNDAWNGYHSVPLREEDRHLTTFITHIGRYWCNRAPQGFVSSGDGFNRRLDELLAKFPRHKRCVDDNLTYDEYLEEHWWRVMNFLELMGKTE